VNFTADQSEKYYESRISKISICSRRDKCLNLMKCVNVDIQSGITLSRLEKEDTLALTVFGVQENVPAWFLSLQKIRKFEESK